MQADLLCHPSRLLFVFLERREFEMLDFQSPSCESTGYFEPLRDLDAPEASGNPLHAAAKLGHSDARIEALAKEAGLAKEVNSEGLTPLHLACDEGHLEIVKILIKAHRRLCFIKNRKGETPLHLAAIKGRVEVVKFLLGACPESVEEVNEIRETCIHCAVVYNKGKVIQYLVKWVSDNGRGHLINAEDFNGNTILHLAASRKQLHTLKLLLTCNPEIRNLVDVNALNSGGFTALDILNVLPYSVKIDKEMDMILRKAGVMRARDITRSHHNYCTIDSCKPSQLSTIKCIIKLRRDFTYNTLLISATLLATITYLVGSTAPASLFKLDSYVYNYSLNGKLHAKKQDSGLIHLFILFNSTGFILSLAMVIFLLHGFPMKPWPQLSISSLFGAHMCSIMAIFPNEALALLFLAIPFLGMAASGGKLHPLG